MFNPATVITALFTRVGWKQPTLSGYDILTGANLVSKSGLFFSDYHKVVTVRNIKDTLEDEAISDADFNEYLEQMQKSAINRVLEGVFNKDVVIEQIQTFSRGWERNLKPLENTGQLVGRRYKVANDVSYITKVNSMALLFDGDVTFKMYCFHTAKGKIWEKEVTAVGNEETVIDLEDLFLAISASNYKAGEFLIGYFQDDLGSVRAINTYACELAAAALFYHTGFRAQPAGIGYDKQTVVEDNLDYGINFMLTSSRDFTEVIVRNASVFDEAVGLQMACNVIEQIMYSTRSNIVERITKELSAAMANDLNMAMPNGEMPYTAGLKNRLEREVKRLNKNFLPKDSIQIITST